MTYILEKIYKGEPKNITGKALMYFSGGDKNNSKFPQRTIHTDINLAQKCGLKNRIASGAMSEGFISELMVNIIGDILFKTGKMRLKFIQVVEMGDTITAYAKIANTDDDITHFDVWCEKQNGIKTAIGQFIIKGEKC